MATAILEPVFLHHLLVFEFLLLHVVKVEHTVDGGVDHLLFVGGVLLEMDELVLVVMNLVGVAARVLLQMEIGGAAGLPHVVRTWVVVEGWLRLHHLLLLAIYLLATGAGQTLSVYLVPEHQAGISFLVSVLIQSRNRLRVLVVNHTLRIVRFGRLAIRMVSTDVVILLYL